jgi:hypothetical protein
MITGDRYDTRTEKWSHIPPMPYPTYGSRAVATTTNIYVLGGFAAGYFDIVQQYDLITRKWSIAPWRLPYPVCNFAANIRCGRYIMIAGGQSSSFTALRTSQAWYFDLNQLNKVVPTNNDPSAATSSSSSNSPSNSSNSNSPPGSPINFNNIPAAIAAGGSGGITPRGSGGIANAVHDPTLIWTSLPDLPYFTSSLQSIVIDG